MKRYEEHVKAERLREERFGHMKPIVHTSVAGQRLVAIGRTVAFSKNWDSFTDFLLDYIKHALGSDWGNAELKKPEADRHQIIKWYLETVQFFDSLERDDEGFITVIPSGPVAAYLCLAYDLYALQKHLALQDEVVKRLKRADQFQGARYELFVAATCVRAGFDLEHEHERNRRKKHPEFTAIHPGTGIKLAVEAKSKHRHGVLDFGYETSRDSLEKANVIGLLQDAFSKEVALPYVVFVDINLPHSEGRIVDKPWVREVIQTIADAGGITPSGQDRFNYLIITNHPQHYGDPALPDLRKDTISVIAKNPVVSHPEPWVAQSIHKSANQFGNIPHEFPDHSG